MFGEWQYVCGAYGERWGWLGRVRRERAGRRTKDDGSCGGRGAFVTYQAKKGFGGSVLQRAEW